MADMLAVVLNGAPRDLPGGSTVADAVGEVAAHTRGVAVAVNGEVVPRTSWGSTALIAGDQIEVLTAVQGG